MQNSRKQTRTARLKTSKRGAIAAAALLFTIATGAVAPGLRSQGQALRFEIPAGQTASGKASDASASTVGVTVGGHGTVTTSVPKGSSSKVVCDAIVAALRAKGFKVTRGGATDFCVEAGPGGKPIEKGGGIGGTDTGITKVDAELKQLGPKRQVKRGGGQIPKVQPKQANARASTNGSIQVDVQVETIVNGKKQLIHVQVVVPIQKGDSAQDIEERARKQLESKGLHPRDVQVPSNLDGRTLMPCFGLDFFGAGDPVLALRIEALQLPPEFFLPTQTWMGVTPPFGIAAEGFGSQERDPWHYCSDPYLGAALQIWIDVGPVPAVGGFFLGGQRAEIPLLPFGPDAFLLVDPLATFLPLPLPANGRMQMQLPLPPDPSLAGIELYTQGLALDTQSLQFATTERLSIRPLQR